MMSTNRIKRIYLELLRRHGSQGWWPLLELHGKRYSVNPTKSGSINGYHPNDYSYPKNDAQRFEICVGAILTQNTAWPNVEKALVNLNNNRLLNPKGILGCDESLLKECIRPAGYYNQKARKLKLFAGFFAGLKGSVPTRNELLFLWGIGPETADSILLYAYNQPVFVVDAYTRKLLISKDIINGTESYDDIRSLLEKGLPKDINLYQEFHALIVEEGKN
jgi:endonuclease-3 related protein